MIQIRRPEAPAKLQAKAETWKAKFLEKRALDPGHRPPSRQYDHPEIKDALRAMSHRKCFYCERLLSADEDTVDHFVDVAEQPELAFEWSNLCLCCGGCQGKLTSEAHENGLDPCGDVDPAEHLFFDDEAIRPLGGSSIGRSTIRRYKLDRLDLTHRRCKHLKLLHKLVIEFQRRHPSGLPEAQREQLRAWMQPEAAFSSMFKCVLAELKI